MDHEEHVQGSKRDGLNGEEIARPDFGPALPQERAPSGEQSAIMVSLHILGDRSRRNLEPKPRQLRLDPSLVPKFGSRWSCAGSGPAAPEQSGGARGCLRDMNAGANRSATRDDASAARFRVSQ